MNHLMLASRRWRPHRLKTAFEGPFTLKDSPWQWWVSDKARDLPLVYRMEAYLSAPEEKGTEVELLRYFKDRSAYRIHTDEGTRFAKRIPLPSWRKRLGAFLGHQNALLGYDHGSAEVDNTLTLHELTDHGLPVHCLGERMRRGLPLPDQQILIQPWLGGTGLDALWPSAGPDLRAELLSHIEKLLGDLYRAHILHMDLHAGNIMVDTAHETMHFLAIDCDKMVTSVRQPDISLALHIGKLLRELEGRRPEDFTRLLGLARDLQYRIAGPSGCNTDTDNILALSLRYRLSKNMSRRRLVMRRSSTIDGRSMEALARRTYKNTGVPPIDWAHLQTGK